MDLNKGTAYNPQESNFLGRMAYSTIFAQSWMNAGIGGYAYGGFYDVQQHPDSSLHGQNAYFGLGPAADINFFLTFQKFNLGTGFDISYAFEFGAYTRTYRDKRNPPYPGYVCGSQRLFIQYNVSDQSRVGLQLFEGIFNFGVQLYYFSEGTGYWISMRGSEQGIAPSLGVSFIIK